MALSARSFLVGDRLLMLKGVHCFHSVLILFHTDKRSRCGKLLPDVSTNALVIRYNGHHPDLMVIDNDGQIRNRFRVDETPNNTGLEVIRWHGGDTPELIYSPAALYDSAGNKVVTFPELPPPTGGKMGWYHCFPADVCSDERDEVILYDPYSDAVYIYTSTPFQPDLFGGYQHTERQYNATPNGLEKMTTPSVNKFLLISIDCWRFDALSRTNSLFNTPKFDLLTQDFSLC